MYNKLSKNEMYSKYSNYYVINNGNDNYQVMDNDI